LRIYFEEAPSIEGVQPLFTTFAPFSHEKMSLNRVTLVAFRPALTVTLFVGLARPFRQAPDHQACEPRVAEANLGNSPFLM